MSNKIYLFFIFTFMFACSNPSKLYDKGNYDKAYKKALSNLKKGKKDRSDIHILNDSYEQLLNEDLTSIERLIKSNDLKDKEKIFSTYNRILSRYDQGKRFLADNYSQPIDKYESDRRLIKAELYEEFKTLGQNTVDLAFQKGDKFLAQDAFVYFDNALKYNQQRDFELDSMQQMALDLGIVTYSVESNSFDYSFKIDRIFDDIEGESDLFREIRYDAIGMVDCEIELDFSDLRQNEYQNIDDQLFSESIITGYQTKIDTSGNSIETPIYDDVEGTVRIVRVERESELLLRVDLNSYTGFCSFNSTNLAAALNETVEVYELSGDERAIPNKYKNNSRDDFKNPDDVVDDLLRILYNDFERLF